MHPERYHYYAFHTWAPDRDRTHTCDSAPIVRFDWHVYLLPTRFVVVGEPCTWYRNPVYASRIKYADSERARERGRRCRRTWASCMHGCDVRCVYYKYRIKRWRWIEWNGNLQTCNIYRQIACIGFIEFTYSSVCVHIVEDDSISTIIVLSVKWKWNIFVK